MNKQEILRKSREDYSENNEMLKEHLKHTRPILIAILVAAAFIFWLDGKYIDGRIISDCIIALVLAVICAEDIYIFYLTKKKLYLFTSILLLVDVLLRGYLLIDTAKDFM